MKNPQCKAGRQIAAFLSSLIRQSRLGNAVSGCGPFLRAIENCAPLPLANTAQRKRLGNRKSEEGISFSPSPCGLFIYLTCLQVHPDSPLLGSFSDRVG